MHRHFVELTNHCTAYSCALFNLRRMDHELGATALSCSLDHELGATALSCSLKRQLLPFSLGGTFECLAWGDSFKPLACSLLLLGNYDLLMNLVCLRVQLAFCLRCWCWAIHLNLWLSLKDFLMRAVSLNLIKSVVLPAAFLAASCGMAQAASYPMTEGQVMVGEDTT